MVFEIPVVSTSAVMAFSSRSEPWSRHVPSSTYPPVPPGPSTSSGYTLQTTLGGYDAAPAAQAAAFVFDRVQLLYHVAASGWTTAFDGYADSSANYLLGPPARRIGQAPRAVSPNRPRRNPGRPSRKNSPKKNPPAKYDNTPSTSSRSYSPQKTRTLPTPMKLRQSASCATLRTMSPPSPLKRMSVDQPKTSPKRTRNTPWKTTPDVNPPEQQAHLIRPSDPTRTLLL
ncbi:DNA-directed RNA polymerase, putative [Ixodes scapularis]|uniref:DNA-directed RNA polymerase, putative n=1 Tax=Ixodes scapularis TaxID=6945 RepID=B7PDA9_IXOSC|nr:DNA-directed RNA polymerase, putative [Ixodes scapularis]|eukprot:XP_002410709.1 DNA-directed RNA polymerase, putative [Ixodes scapularis]